MDGWISISNVFTQADNLKRLSLTFSVCLPGACRSSATQTAVSPATREERQDGGGGDYAGVAETQDGTRLDAHSPNMTNRWQPRSQWHSSDLK